MIVAKVEFQEFEVAKVEFQEIIPTYVLQYRSFLLELLFLVGVHVL